MIFTTKAEYGVRLLVELGRQSQRHPVSLKAIAEEESLPIAYLERIAALLKKAGIVEATRGAHGGYRLDRLASEISVADVFRAVDGPLAEVRGDRPEASSYVGPAEGLREVWVAVRASLRSVLEEVSIEQIARNELPESVRELTREPGAWLRR